MQTPDPPIVVLTSTDPPDLLGAGSLQIYRINELPGAAAASLTSMHPGGLCFHLKLTALWRL